jgi:ATP-dependent Lon protease
VNSVADERSKGAVDETPQASKETTPTPSGAAETTAPPGVTEQAQAAGGATAQTQPPTEATLEIPDALPVLPLRGGIVIFPQAVVPLTIGQERSVQLVDEVMRGNRMLALVSQKNDEIEQPGPDDLNRVGTAAIIHQLLRAPDGGIRLVVQGLERVRLLDFTATEPFLVARVEPIPDRATEGVSFAAS